MSRKGQVFNNGVLAGVIEEKENDYTFTYDTAYLTDSKAKALSLTMPKRKEPYASEHLFPFFHGILAEGVTKDLQCRILKIDEEDYFGRLLKTAHDDVIGSITVETVEES